MLRSNDPGVMAEAVNILKRLLENIVSKLMALDLTYMQLKA